MTTNQELVDHLNREEATYDVYEAIDELAETVFENNMAKGFWDAAFFPVPVLHEMTGETTYDTEFEPSLRNFGECVALIMEELGEMMRADRKQLMDDHLEGVEGRWGELADVIIRGLDLAGAYNVPIGTIIRKKLEYNLTRPYRHGKAY